jgi:hypothetical protein
VTCFGTTANRELLDNKIVVEAAAVPFNVTVPVEVAPPATLAGVNITDLRVGGTTVNVPAFPPKLSLAVIDTLVFAPTGNVVTLNVAVVAPAATVTIGGKVVAGLLVERFNHKPPDGAGLDRLTTPVVVDPPTTVDGFIETSLTATAPSNGFDNTTRDPLAPARAS